MNGWIEDNYYINWHQLGTAAFNWLLYLIAILVVARIVYGVSVYLLQRTLLDQRGKRLLNERKASTMFSLLRSLLFYLISFTAILHVLKHLFNFDTGTLLASASVLGVALGFGSQSLVKDIIGGFFILFEDQFSVGEYVQAGQFSGVVEETGIRATHLRDWGGELHIIPNGSITAVTNFSRGKMRALVDILIPYDEDLERAMKVMHSVCEKVSEEFGEKIIDKPTVQGVIQFGERNAILRVVGYTQPNEQWGLERELRRQIHSAFLKEGIRTPQQTIVMSDASFNSMDSTK
ncbi:small-conductance mechanosensitive channel [Desulfosporosinus orientis DSM 765]|uniref:Small-conductance mechanosensitive channel n=1 Tax=Desulfosporosinus orientis (strain ATCC 19365 / DSM 765 / NCIMB 8382 / VKM B-1628 / Singapore I) TaxID=768706 RepID=G7WI58_DESOD|nr:mechanosensitive ion channel family protein [Desulfosporosinus orientis]AET70981.1 small-conductance mechanosensitive channel [Desulfosporosinus orientis DSM 765]